MEKLIYLLIGCLLGLLIIDIFDKPDGVKYIDTPSFVDTVFVDRYLKPEKEYKYIEVPKQITVWKYDTVFVDSIKLVKDTIVIYQDNGVKLDISTQFLTQYPYNDKLISMVLSDKKLDLNLLSTNGNLYSKNHAINTKLYTYNYINNDLTFKRKPFFQRFSPVAQFTIRPFHNLYDIDLGLRYNTSKFNYELGLNSFYYPRINNSLGIDLYLRANYIF